MKRFLINEACRVLMIVWPLIWTASWILALPYQALDWFRRAEHFDEFNSMHSRESWSDWWNTIRQRRVTL
jgi:hypothetical protein